MYHPYKHKITLAINQAHQLYGLLAFKDGKPTGLPVLVTANVHEERVPTVMTVWLDDDGMERYRQVKDQLEIPRIYVD